MKTLFLVTTLSLLASFGVFAQEINQDTSTKKKIITQALFPFGNQNFVKVNSDDFEEPSVLEFSTYNSKNKLLYQQTISTQRENEWFAIEGTFVWDSTLVVLASLYYPGPQKNHLLLYQYSLPTLELVQSKVLLKTFAPSDTRIPFLHKLSPDTSKLVIAAWSYRDTEKKANAPIELSVYNQNFDKLEQFQKVLPFKNKRLFPDDVLIDNQGRCYYIGANYTADPNGEIRSSAMKKFILAFFLPENKDSLFQLPRNKVDFKETKFLINAQQELVGLNLSRIGSRINFGGTSLLKLNPLNQTFFVNYQEFTKKQFKAAFAEPNPSLPTPKHIFDDGYSLQQVFTHPTGYYLTGERYEPTGWDWDAETLEETVANYELQDIFVIKIDKNGRFQWMSRIPKNQSLTDEFAPFFSYKAFKRKNDLLFLFNDTPNKPKIQHAEKQILSSNLKDVSLMITQLSLSDGHFKKRRLQNLLSNQYLAYPNFIHQISANELFFYAKGQTTRARKSIVKVLPLKPD